MTQLRTRIIPTLSSIPDECLDEITADGHVFAGTRWLRMLDELDLASLIGGRTTLQFAVVTADDVPVALAPLLRSTGEGMYFVYSMRRYYFEHWIDEAVRMEPGRREYFARIFTAVSAYRRLLEWTGSSLDDCLIVTNPMAYRGHVPVAPSAPAERQAIYNHLVGELQRVARRMRLPLWFLCAPGEHDRFGQALQSAGCQKSFQFYDNCIDLDAFDSFDAYLASFRRTTRRAFLRDIRRTERAGVRFQIANDFGGIGDALTRLYTDTYGKYGDSFFRHPPVFWTRLQQSMGDQVELVLASSEDRLIGFTVLLNSRRRGEMWTYRIGRVNDTAEQAIPFYFTLSFYEPIRRALERGCRRLWLGPASYEAKSVRGARQVPLYSYFWFPRRWDRWLLQPYLKLFGNAVRDQIAKSIERPMRVTESNPVGRRQFPKDAA